MEEQMVNDDQIQSFRVESLTDYIKVVIELNKSLSGDGRSESLFFRGQNNIEWDIRPGIFRNSLVNCEEKIIQMAVARAPFEFNNHTNAFEKLTKLQHYGLPTRLLDVTMNPLVALYFACLPDPVQKSTDVEEAINVEKNEDQEIPNVEKGGAVFYSYAYDESVDSLKIQFISSIALREIDKDTTLNKLKEDLFGIHNEIDPKNFISIIQGNYFVKSHHNNDRLIRQSGAFMLPGAITISENADDLWSSKILKSVCGLNSEFSQDKIFIPEKAKEQILDELDFCNINEGTLFPELEHQMSHIKKVSTKMMLDLVVDFTKYESKIDIPSFDVSELNDISIDESNIKESIAKYVKDLSTVDKVFMAIDNTSKYTDWTKKESVLSSLMSNIKRVLSDNGAINPKETAKNIVQDVINNI